MLWPVLVVGLAAAAPGGVTPIQSTAPSVTLRIAAASDLRFALAEAVTRFHALNPAIRVEAAYGSSGNFFAQIREGAPFDVFLCADTDYVDRLAREGLGEKPFPYAIGRLALVVRKDAGFDPGGFAELLKGTGIRRLAIANPAHAPYGRAAEATLRFWKIYDAVAPRLVLGESVSQAAQYVDAGAAQAGLVALALARAQESNFAYAEIPQEAHPRLDQAGLILKTSASPAAARAFQDFLTGETGRGLLSRYGFGLPPR